MAELFKDLSSINLNIEDMYQGLRRCGKVYVDELKSYQKEIAKTIEETEKQVEKYLQV